MNDEQTSTFLILKYGSIEVAFSKWMSGTASFNEDEDEYLAAHSKKMFPNLNLIRHKD